MPAKKDYRPDCERCVTKHSVFLSKRSNNESLQEPEVAKANFVITYWWTPNGYHAGIMQKQVCDACSSEIAVNDQFSKLFDGPGKKEQHISRTRRIYHAPGEKSPYHDEQDTTEVWEGQIWVHWDSPRGQEVRSPSTMIEP